MCVQIVSFNFFSIIFFPFHLDVILPTPAPIIVTTERSNTGSLTSPNYPDPYDNRLQYNVTVLLEQTGPQTVHLTFDDFDLEDSSGCLSDYVMISGVEDQRWCGEMIGHYLSRKFLNTILLHEKESTCE